MKPYHKIDSVYKRDPETNHKNFLIGQYSRPEFGLLARCPWHVTEKIDGTNIRIDWRDGEIRFGGRTDKAQLPAPLFEELQRLFTARKLELYFGVSGRPFTLYGEGYGAGIQKGGGNYISDGVSFILFDVLYDDKIWLTQEDVTGVAAALGIKRVPVIADYGQWNLWDIIEVAKVPQYSQLGNKNFYLEGFIMRPQIELNDRRGNRIITKVKLKDFVYD